MDYDTDWARRPAARVARRAVVDALMRPGIGALAKPHIEGLDRLDEVEGPVIYSANHHSHLDIFLLLSALPERFRKRAVVAAAADYFFDKRWKATLSALAIGAIPIERNKVNRASSDRAQKLIQAGWNLVIFPEGGRSPDGWGQQPKAGAAFISVRTGVPIVPVHIEGTGRVLPKGKSLPKPGTTTVTYGSPIAPGAKEDPRELSERVERAIALLADEEANGWWAARRNAAAGTTPSLRGPQDVASWRRVWALGAKDKVRERTKRSWP